MADQRYILTPEKKRKQKQLPFALQVLIIVAVNIVAIPFLALAMGYLMHITK